VSADRPVLGALTDADTDAPLYELGPGIVLAVTLNREGFVQIIGLPNLDPIWTATALINLAQAIVGGDPNIKLHTEEPT
jgi:hypothetical protein